MSEINSKSVQISLPAEVVELLGVDRGQLGVQVQQALVLQLFLQGSISSGKAAELLHISKDSFRSLLEERRIPYFRQSLEDVVRDAEVASSAKAES